MDRAALAGFLRRRREALQPGDVGLPAGPPRTEAYEKLQLLAVLGQQHFAGVGPVS